MSMNSTMTSTYLGADCGDVKPQYSVIVKIVSWQAQRTERSWMVSRRTTGAAGLLSLVAGAVIFAAGAALLASVPSARAQAGVAPIQIVADLSEGAERSSFTLEVRSAGEARAADPDHAGVIPPTHRPEGPVSEYRRRGFTATGRRSPWRRDDGILFEFHWTVPKAFSSIHAHSGFHRDRSRYAEDGDAGVGDTDAVSSGRSGEGDRDPALGCCACGLGIGTALTAAGNRPCARRQRPE